MRCVNGLVFRSNSTPTGLTILEMLIVCVLLVVVLCGIAVVQTGTLRQADKTVDVNDACRSTLIALEAIRQDVGRMSFLDPKKELQIEEDGRQLTVSVAHPSLKRYWDVEFRPLRYSLAARPGSGCRLMRDDNGEAPARFTSLYRQPAHPLGGSAPSTAVLAAGDRALVLLCEIRPRKTTETLRPRRRTENTSQVGNAFLWIGEE
jgi:type II secretory pathway pseudopilin PulG